MLKQSCPNSLQSTIHVAFRPCHRDHQTTYEMLRHVLGFPHVYEMINYLKQEQAGIIYLVLSTRLKRYTDNLKDNLTDTIIMFNFYATFVFRILVYIEFSSCFGILNPTTDSNTYTDYYTGHFHLQTAVKKENKIKIRFL